MNFSGRGDKDVSQVAAKMKLKMPLKRMTEAEAIKTIQQQNEVDFKSEGWTQLMEAQKNRDRVTHPKTAEALKISEEEMKTVNAGYNWYVKTINRMLERLGESNLGRGSAK